MKTTKTSTSNSKADPKDVSLAGTSAVPANGPLIAGDGKGGAETAKTAPFPLCRRVRLTRGALPTGNDELTAAVASSTETAVSIIPNAPETRWRS